MRIAILSPIAWRTPPRHYGPWEQVASLLTEELVARGHDVTLFATADSITGAKLNAVCKKGYAEDESADPKVCECLHIANLFEHAHEFDIIHNHFDFLPLTCSLLVKTPMVTTIHGFSSPQILPVFERYNGKTHYVSISNADRSPELTYIATVYHGIDLKQFTFKKEHGDFLLFFGRIHHDKGTKEAIEIAQKAGKKLVIAGIVQDEAYFKKHVEPHLDQKQVAFVGSADPKMRNELLQETYALLHPINFAEPFGLSVIEAMACGTPAIAFNKGSMPEIITTGRDGILVDTVDEAVEAVARVASLDRSVCRKKVEKKFTCGRMAEEYIRVYENICR